MRTTIAELMRGTSAGIATGYHFRGRIENDPNGDIPVVQAKDIDWSRQLVSTELMHVKLEKDPAPHLLRAGDVLFLSRGHRHWALAITGSMPRFIAPGYFFILRVDTARVRPEYLTWFINHPATQELLRGKAKGTQIPFLSKDDVESMTVPLPPLATQDKVVALAGLARREQDLLDRLAKRRRVLLDTICLDLATAGERG
jgi:hypothetical protein